MLTHISFFPLLQGARRRCGGGGKAGGIARERAGAAGGAPGRWLCSGPLPPPQINEVAVVVRVQEFDAGLAGNCPGLPGPACMSGSLIL